VPAEARHRPGRAERAQPDDHRDDQPEFLDHFAGVLQRVDQEPEDGTGHDRQQRLVEQLRQRSEAEEQRGQVHEGDQREPGDRAHDESPKRCLAAAEVSHLMWFTTGRYGRSQETLTESMLPADSIG